MIAGLRSSSPTKSLTSAPSRGPRPTSKAARSRRVRERGRARAVGADALKAALAERGMKAGGTLAERAARLFEAKGVSDLSTLPRALVAKRKASATAPADNGPRQPRGPLGPGQTMRPGATRLPTHKSPSNPRAPRKQPRSRHDRAQVRGRSRRRALLVDAPGAASNRERDDGVTGAREIREPDGRCVVRCFGSEAGAAPVSVCSFKGMSARAMSPRRSARRGDETGPARSRGAARRACRTERP